MCTAITLQSEQNENWFGRTMDFSHEIDPHVYIVPQNYVWNTAVGGIEYTNPFSFIGIGQQVDELLVFFDGVNEKGLAGAALYFAGYAQFFTPEDITADKTPVASFDFLHYVLANCDSIAALEKLLPSIMIVGVTDPVTKTIAPLHWMVTDRSGSSVVVEQTEAGLNLFKNEIGVMANSPDFPWHMTNLRNYINATPKQQSTVDWDGLELVAFGQGGGSSALPGGFTSPERFVRTAFTKTHLQVPETRPEMPVTCFHSLMPVFIGKGIVLTERGTIDYTKYITFVNTQTCQYFFKHYNSAHISVASLFPAGENAAELILLGSLSRPLLFEQI